MLYLSGVVRPDLPAMLQPGMGNLPPVGQPWAADNGRFSSPKTYTDARYLAWLAKRPGQDRCLFATAPDVVGDAAATLALSAPMFAPIRALGYPVAFVGQDGQEHLPVPWNDFDVLFLGGTTAWKLGPAAEGLAREAKRRGKWVHMGRVNSLRRMRYAESIGCDSADGTVLKHDTKRPVASWGPRVLSEPSLWRESA
jgi:hypothetical protein